MEKRTKKIIEERHKALLTLIKENTRTDIIERELALLAIDVILAMQTKGAAKTGCLCFREIDLAITGALRRKLGEETRDLINEMIILDEFGEKYGPNLKLIFDLAQKTIGAQSSRFIAGISRPVLTAK